MEETLCSLSVKPPAKAVVVPAAATIASAKDLIFIIDFLISTNCLGRPKPKLSRAYALLLLAQHLVALL
jgi:hypothetical protein